MGNGDEPEQPENPHEPTIDNIVVTNITVVDDTGYRHEFWGEIDLSLISLKGETRVHARMRCV